MSTSAELKKLKVAELKELLTAKGLDTTGVKDVLIERLLAAQTAEPAEAGAPAAAAAEPSSVPEAAAPVAEAKPAAPAETAAEAKAQGEAPGDGAAEGNAEACARPLSSRSADVKHFF